jgi:hypothetical protein
MFIVVTGVECPRMTLTALASMRADSIRLAVV